MHKELQSVCSRRNRILRLTVCTRNVECALNELVEQRTNEQTEKVGGEVQIDLGSDVQSLLESGSWGYLDVICADCNGDDNFHAAWLALGEWLCGGRACRELLKERCHKGDDALEEVT